MEIVRGETIYWNRNAVQANPATSSGALFLGLGREQQGITLAPPRICRIRCLGVRYVLRVYGNDTRAAPMSGHHYSQRLILAHAKFRPQNCDDELAGREIIIDQDDFMQTRPFGLYLIFDLGFGDGVSHGWTAFMGTDRLRGAYRACSTFIRCRHPYPAGPDFCT